MSTNKMLETSIFTSAAQVVALNLQGFSPPLIYLGRLMVDLSSYLTLSGWRRRSLKTPFCSGASRSFVGVFTSKLECTSTNSVVLLLKLVKFSTEVWCHTLTLKLKRPKLRNTLFLQKSQTNVSYFYANPIPTL